MAAPSSIAASAFQVPLKRVLTWSQGRCRTRATDHSHSRSCISASRWISGSSVGWNRSREFGARPQTPPSNQSRREPPTSIQDVFPDLFSDVGGAGSSDSKSRSPWDKAFDAAFNSPYDASSAHSRHRPASATPDPRSYPGFHGSDDGDAEFSPNDRFDGSSRDRAAIRSRDTLDDPSSRTRMARDEIESFQNLLEDMFKAFDGTSPKSRQKKALRPHTDEESRKDMERYPRINAGNHAFGSRYSGDEETYSGMSSSSSGVMRSVGLAKDMPESVLQDFERIKEEIAKLYTDAEILEWARENALKPQLITEDGVEIQADESQKITTPQYFSFPPTYPLVLAHLMSIFRTQFGDASLALAIFNHARSHSAESYVIGCSTGSYNEYLETLWSSFSNLRGVKLGLEEMQQNGVGWDRRTMRLVSGIVEELQGRILNASSGFGGTPRMLPGHTDRAEDNRSGVIGTDDALRDRIISILRVEFGPDVMKLIAELENHVQAHVESDEKRHRMQLKRHLDDVRQRGGSGSHQRSSFGFRNAPA